MKYNAQVGEKTEGFEKDKPKVKRTMFNRSRMKHQQADFGTLDVLDCFEVLPNEEGKLNYTVRLKARNPTIRPIKTPIKIRIDSWLVYKNDCWEGFKDHISGGNTGTSKPNAPLLYYMLTENQSNSVTTADTTWRRGHTLTPNSLANQLGIPVPQFTKTAQYGSATGYYTSNNRFCDNVPSMLSDSATTATTVKSEYRSTNDEYAFENMDLTKHKLMINALPFVAYQKIARRYQNYNILYKNTYLYPKVENHFKLPYTVSDSGYVNALDYDSPLIYSNTWFGNGCAPTMSSSATENYDSNRAPNYYNGAYGNKPVRLDAKRNVQLNGDVYTTASPFAHLIRNNASQPTVYDGLLMAEVMNLSPTERDDLLNTYGDTLTERITYLNTPDTVNSFANMRAYANTDGDTKYGIISSTSGANAATIDYAEKAMLSLVNANMESLRNMAVLTRLKEKIGKINQVDFYNGFIESTFGVNPRTEIGEPIYIGGETFDLASGSKLTTNDTIANSNNYGEMGTLEGTFTANIGSYKSLDHAYVITTLNIVPDNAYSGLEKMFSKIMNEEEYIPDYNALEPMAIKAKEISLGVNYSGLTSDFENIIGYTDRYYDFKSRQTKLVGLNEDCKMSFDGTSGDTTNFLSEYDHCQFITRMLGVGMSELALSASKTTFYDDYLTVDDEPVFDADIYCGVKSLMPLPYKSREMQNII